MLLTEPMKKIELLVMKADLDAVMRYLGFAGCLQLTAEGHEQRDLSAEEREIADLRQKVLAVARFLGIETAPSLPPEVKAPDRAHLHAQAHGLLESTRGLLEEEAGLLQRKLALEKTVDELSVFDSLKIDFEALKNAGHVVFRLASVAPEKVAALEKKLATRALVVRLERPGHLLVVAPKKGRWALDSELKRVDAVDVHLPGGMKGAPTELLSSANADLAAAAEGLRALDERKRQVRDAWNEELGWLLVQLDLDTTIDTAKQGFTATGSIERITGWVPRRRCPEIASALDSLTQGRLALKTMDPEEVPEVKKGTAKVPVAMRHGRLARSFERMVLSYSVPPYGAIDPTPFVGIIFIVLFAIMFGDVGQGLVGLLLGLLISSGKVPAFAAYKKKNFGTVFILAGAASMVAGFLYGSFFANEELLVPLSILVSGAVFHNPVEHIISLQGFQRIIAFFGITVGLGAVINTVGLVLNIVNAFRRRDWAKAVLSKTGLAGAFFFWYVLFIAVRILLGRHLVTADFVALGIPLLLLFLRELLIHLFSGHRPLLKDGAFAFVMEGIVEILESTIYYVSNSVSFLRVAAFALAHTVLSTIIYLLADMVGAGPAGILFRVLVILIGNAIIIVLEGLIVTIQVVRLQYYEFFSKFFNESGEEFAPFVLRTSGGLR
jgi:V/A-type H+/Na+-transporting ATPase subunit I